MSKPVPALVPAMAGAVAAVAVALLIGWPGRAPATGIAVVTAAAAIAVVAVLLVARVAAAGRRRALRTEGAPASLPAVRGSVAIQDAPAPSNLVAA
jgi:hypothetical protein